MLRSMKDLEDYAIRATDGDIGHVKDFYFDDDTWVVRYLVVETGSWLSGRKVLISPIAIGEPDWTARALPVSITKEQVKNSPDLDTDEPVSRQHERQYLEYYGYPYYWGGTGLWGSDYNPGAMLTNPGYGGCYADYGHAQVDHARAKVVADRHEDGDAHLRSCKVVGRRGGRCRADSAGRQRCSALRLSSTANSRAGVGPSQTPWPGWLLGVRAET